MEYTVQKLAKMSGISARTLRYYDQIGLLRPARINASGYRIYGSEQVDMLQQILIYRALDVNLDNIKTIVTSPSFDRAKALRSHLTALTQSRERIDLLIENVKKTIASIERGVTMPDTEKFKAFLKNMVDENEAKYGDEIREKYGDEAIDASNAKVMGMTPEQYKESERIGAEFAEALKSAVEAGDPSGPLARRACELHKKSIMVFWTEYSPERHMGLGEMYVADERFKAYYEKIVPGGTEFLRDAINSYFGK